MSEFELVRSERTVWFVRRDEHGFIVEVREAPQAQGTRQPGANAPLQRRR
jgi:hypothetical protein